MALSIDGYPDPDDAPGATIDGVYVWIPEVNLSYSDGTARFVIWVHQSAEAAATWPDGARVPHIARLPVYCGAEVVGVPGVTFPALETVMGRAATMAGDLMAAADSPEEEASTLAMIASGGAIRAALYAYINELIYPTAVEAE